MAQKIKLAKGKEFTFATVKGGGEAKYPWDQWLNGDLLLLERSTGTEDEKGTVTEVAEKKDYEVATNAMPGKLKGAARRNYKVVQISRLDAEGKRLRDALIIKARDMTQSERDDEDLLRAEEHEAMVARRAKAKAEANGTTHTAAPAPVPTA